MFKNYMKNRRLHKTMIKRKKKKKNLSFTATTTKSTNCMNSA